MYSDATQRIINEAEHIVKTGATVRECAKVFGVSKSTVHSDVVKKLEFIDADLCQKVKRVLYINLSERHIRGGMATRRKYKCK